MNDVPLASSPLLMPLMGSGARSFEASASQTLMMDDVPSTSSNLLMPPMGSGARMCATSSRSPQSSPCKTPFKRVDMTKQLEPCTENKFYGRYMLAGTELFRYIEALGIDDRDVDCRQKLSEVVLPIGDDSPLEASYQAFGVTIIIHAAHLAASLGSIKVMKWLRDTCGSDILDKPAVEVRGNRRVLTYTPLMSALFMSKTEAALWLLNHGASPTVTNADGMTPFHLLASIGLPNESADARISSLAKVAAKLVEKSADLNAHSGLLEHRTDPEAARTRDKTPLELAAGRNSAYPKQALHLLTTSFHRPEQGSLFKEVDFVAMSNPTAAEMLLQKMQEQNLGAVKQQLRHEVIEQVAHEQHIEMFLRILKMSPVAGVNFLELLMIEPLVSNPQRYPLPLYTELPGGQMITTYQEGNEAGRPVWESKEPMPKWHSHFKKDLPADPMMHENVHEVHVRVLHLPGILNIRVLSTLSVVKQSGNMRIFGKVSVNGIISCVWLQCVNIYRFSLAWECLLLAALVSIGIYPPPSNCVAITAGIHSVIVANLLQDVLHTVWGLARFTTETGLPLKTYLWTFERGSIFRIFALILMLHVHVHLRTGIHKVFTAINVLMRCFTIMGHLKVVPLIGPLIISVIYSFLPMRGMFIFMGIIFTTFSLAFLIFKDANRSAGFVLLYLYEALFLADRESAESISGLDIAHQQTLDFNVQMFTGGGDDWVLGASIVIVLFAASVFSLVLLNLMVGMYTKYYEQMETMAGLVYQQQRAKECVSFMLRPAWALALRVRNEGYSSNVLFLAALGGLLLYLLATYALASVLITAPLLMYVSQLYQAVLLYNISNVGQRDHFLWVSYRVDFEDQHQDEQQELRALRREMVEARAAHQSELSEVRRELNKLTRELAGTLTKVAS
mmetsp:Transcript_168797/g.542505  ORF Transcript_168797/g.542505 Transcript_168797/m.542505 type:complete len:902 (+) Transcript_168797:127-2832(+)